MFAFLQLDAKLPKIKIVLSVLINKFNRHRSNIFNSSNSNGKYPIVRASKATRTHVTVKYPAQNPNTQKEVST